MCWSSRREFRGYWGARTTSEPRRLSRDLRVSDADRQDVIAQLSRHTGDGRLTLEEFEERVEEVYNAKTEPELRHTLRDLPVQHQRRRSRVTADLGRALSPVVVAVLLIAAVAITVPWVLWFVIPFAWCHWGSWGHGEQVDDRARDEDRELTHV